MSLLLEIPLTGERTYVHGADIFDALTAATGARRSIRLSLRSAGDCAMELLDEAAAPAGVEPCGRFRYACAAGTVRHVLLHRPDRPIAIRVPMSDEALAAGIQSGTFMQRLSALIVALLEHDFPEDYWSIAEISCLHLPQSDARPAAAIVGSVGNRFWKIAGLADGVAVGHVIMARGQPYR